MITQKISWVEFRAMIFSRIAQLVEDSSCSSYTVLGYKYLDTKLILHYSDCDRVFLFQYKPIDEYHTNTDLDKQFSETSFYTEDYTHEQYMDGIKNFSSNWDRYKPDSNADVK